MVLNTNHNVLFDKYDKKKIQKKEREDLYFKEERAIRIGSSQKFFPKNAVSTAKYTVWNFLFINMYEQFSKLGNIYFQLLSILQLIPSVSITNGVPTIQAPLIFIIFITAIKDILEDYQRHRSDNEENNSLVQKFKVEQLANNNVDLTRMVDANNEDQIIQEKWSSLMVGDIIKINCDSFIPADMIMLSNSDYKKGQAFIETKNLDGETNLKPKIINSDLKKKLAKQNDCFNVYNNCNIISEPPNTYITKYKGFLQFEDNNKLEIDNNLMLQKGCIQRNTEWVIGCVVFSGHQTKIMLNSVKAKPKRSDLERITNQKIILIFILQLILVFTSGLVYAIWEKVKYDEIDYYMEVGRTNFLQLVIIRTGNWLLIFGNFIPISLMVTMEWVKLIQGRVIAFDKKFEVEGLKDSGCNVQSSNLVEEQGQINYIFSDKTGTLTCNQMNFKEMTILSKSYGTNTGFKGLFLPEKELTEKNNSVYRNYDKEISNMDFSDFQIFKDLVPTLKEKVNNKNQEILELLKKYDSTNETKTSPTEDQKMCEGVVEMLLCLAICHDIVLDTVTGKLNANSPDELAFVNLAKYAGVEFLGEDDDFNVVIDVFGEKRKYKKLEVFEFDSDRKRMTVIVETPEKKICAYMKGADMLVLPRLANHNSIDFTLQKLNQSAEIGLRTQLMCVKYITQDEWLSFKENYNKAKCDLKNKDENVAKIQGEFEQNFIILGSTAIEDKLQDQVADTIEFIRNAGIKLWVLTGDKVSTAKNIAYSCALINNQMKQIEFEKTSIEDLKEECDFFIKEIEKIRREDALKSICLIMNGNDLATISSTQKPKEKNRNNSEKTLADQFTEIALKCDVCLCCRVTPKQKAEIVLLIKNNVPGTITAAIGDGANDVNMITEANLGIGLRGVEGAQAARASDFAFGEFKCLKRLLFLYGRESYRTNSNMILYMFYKNILICFPQWWWGIYNLYSGQTQYEKYHYQLYNVVYTSLPIFIYAIFDREFSEEKFMSNYGLYAVGLKREQFNSKRFLCWFVAAAIEAGQIVLVCQYLIDDKWANNDGGTYGFWIFGMVVFFSVSYLANLKIIGFSNTFSILHVVILFLSCISLFATWFVVSLLSGSVLENTFEAKINSAAFWLIVIFITGLGVADYSIARLYSSVHSLLGGNCIKPKKKPSYVSGNDNSNIDLMQSIEPNLIIDNENKKMETKKNQTEKENKVIMAKSKHDNVEVSWNLS